jgi:hypothetical protein
MEMGEGGKTREEKEKGKEKQLAVNEEGDKKEGNDDEFAEPDAVTLLNLVEPLWQDLANAWERVQEPKKSMELFVLWEEVRLPSIDANRPPAPLPFFMSRSA